MKMKNMKVVFTGTPGLGVTAKDMALAMIGQYGTAAGTGYAIEYSGDAVTALSMEGRMTVCNMAIEAGARAGMIACDDDTTIEYVKGRHLRTQGRACGKCAPRRPGATCTRDDDAALRRDRCACRWIPEPSSHR